MGGSICWKLVWCEHPVLTIGIKNLTKLLTVRGIYNWTWGCVKEYVILRKNAVLVSIVIAAILNNIRFGQTFSGISCLNYVMKQCINIISLFLYIVFRLSHYVYMTGIWSYLCSSNACAFLRIVSCKKLAFCFATCSVFCMFVSEAFSI